MLVYFRFAIERGEILFLMDKETLLKKYGDFLKVHIKESSIKSYVQDYLIGGFRNVINKHFEAIFAKQFDVLEYFCTLGLSSRRFLCEIFLMMMRQEKLNSNKRITDKTLSNYKSSFVAFMAFNDDMRFLGKDEYSKLLSTFKYDFFFSKKDILENFEFRIKSQDRFYEQLNVCLPCRFLEKPYQTGKKNWNRYTKVVDEMLERCKIIVNCNGKFIRLKQVKNIRIVNQEFIVSYGSNGQETKIYTEIYQKNIFKGYKIQKGNILKDISLDHDTPLYKMYPSYLATGVAPLLSKLGKDYLLYRQTHKNLSDSSLPCDYYRNRYSALKIDTDELLKEVQDFFSKVNLTIMDRRINSSKNKN